MESKENPQEVELDEYEVALKGKLEELTACQKQKNFKSCRQCSEFFECELRKVYVDTVFNSMSKGETGGFEF